MSVRFHESQRTCLIARTGQTHDQFRASAKMIMSEHLLAAIQKMSHSDLLNLVSAVHPHEPVIHREHKVVLIMVVDNLWEAAESLFKLRGIEGVAHLLHLVVNEGLNTAVNVVALRKLVGEMKGRRFSSTKSQVSLIGPLTSDQTESLETPTQFERAMDVHNQRINQLVTRWINLANDFAEN